MEVVLLENIKNLGKIGDIVDVRRGHGRNFLIKYGKALKASEGTVGTILVLSAANDSRTVVVKNGTGNIVCGADFTLDNSSDTITLIWGGSQWMQISSSNNAA